MTLTPGVLLRFVGVILMGIVFVHLWEIPWGLVAAAGVACLVLG